jgi:pilus assembly protein CpaE
MFDYVVLDTPGAFNDIVGTAIECATQVLVVTSVDMASIKDTSFILDLLESESFPDERLLLTVNHANGANTIRASDIERVLRKSVYWEIPHDSEVTLATQVGKPVVIAKPRSRAAQNMTGLAYKISGRGPAKKDKKDESKSLLKRLARSRN